jgi:hypothetical protein
MKKLVAVAVIAILSYSARADYTNAVTDNIASNIAGYQLIASGWVGTNTLTDIGISTNVAYVCIPVSELTYLTEATAAESGGSSSYRTLVFSLVKSVYEHISGLASTNRPERLTATEAVRTSSASDVKFTHSFDTDISVSTAGVADE